MDRMYRITKKSIDVDYNMEAELYDLESVLNRYINDESLKEIARKNDNESSRTSILYAIENDAGRINIVNIYKFPNNQTHSKKLYKIINIEDESLKKNINVLITYDKEWVYSELITELVKNYPQYKIEKLNLDDNHIINRHFSLSTRGHENNFTSVKNIINFDLKGLL